MIGKIVKFVKDKWLSIVALLLSITALIVRLLK